MIHWIQPPTITEVAQYIECYWFIEKRFDSQSDNYPKLNPDPSAHLIISPPNQIYCYDMNPGIVNGEGSHWLFPHHQTLQLDHSSPFVHLGIKFHAGALYSLAPFSGKTPLLDKVADIRLDTQFISYHFNERQLIELARSKRNQCCKQLDSMFSPWLAMARENKHSQLTRKALQALDSTSISELGRQLYCSQRTLERSFNRVTGLTLKQCQSMNKLEAMLEYLYLST